MGMGVGQCGDGGDGVGWYGDGGRVVRRLGSVGWG